MKIYFAPHSTSKDNEAKIASGWKDVGLSELGIKQSKELVKKFKDIKELTFDVEKYILQNVFDFFVKLGFDKNKLRFKFVSKEERPFYSLATWDLEALVEEIGWVEICANNYRSDHDLKSHSKASKKDLRISEDGNKIFPHIFEISMGLDRILYSLLSQKLIKINDKNVLKLNPFLQPYDFAIFPLVKKDGLLEKAKEIFDKLNCGAYNLLFNEKGSIGKRYAKSDEVGIRYAITIDYDTLKDQTITLRDAWKTTQIRVKINDLNNKLFELKYNFNK